MAAFSVGGLAEFVQSMVETEGAVACTPDLSALDGPLKFCALAAGDVLRSFESRVGTDSSGMRWSRVTSCAAYQDVPDVKGTQQRIVDGLLMPGAVGHLCRFQLGTVQVQPDDVLWQRVGLRAGSCWRVHSVESYQLSRRVEAWAELLVLPPVSLEGAYPLVGVG